MSISALNWAFNMRGVSVTQKVVLIALANFADEAGYAFPSIKTIADMSCVSESSVRRALSDLVEARILRIDYRFRADGSQTSSGYFLEVTPPVNLTPPPSTVTPPPVTADTPYNHHITTTFLDTDVSNRNVHEPLGDFDTFWKAWPHKVGKPAAVKSYQAAIKRGDSHEQVMNGLRRYIQSKPPDRAWLNPATFLNQERYNDEPASNQSQQFNHTTINPDGSTSAQTFGGTIPFPNKQGLGGRAGAALRSLQERQGLDRGW